MHTCMELAFYVIYYVKVGVSKVKLACTNSFSLSILLDPESEDSNAGYLYVFINQVHSASVHTDHDMKFSMVRLCLVHRRWGGEELHARFFQCFLVCACI